MSNVVQSVERALDILEILSEDVNGMGLSEIGNKIDLHKSTIHRLLGTLIHKGYVSQDCVTNKYKITIKLYELGVKKIASTDILEASKPYSKALMDSLNEVVHLVIRDKNDIIYIDKVEADNTIRMISTIGKRRPLYCTSVGKAMMAYMSEEEIKEIWDNSEIESLTQKTIVDYEDFLSELDKVKTNGYAEDDEENEMGVRCIGAPIFNHKGQIEGAISISGPAFRVTKERVDEISKEVKKYAKLISKELGYRTN